jgi:hypothetical protein
MKKYVLPLILIFVLPACNLGTTIKEAIHLSSEIKDKYHCNEAEVTVNNGSEVVVTISNSSYQDSSDDIKQRVANEIGQMVIADKKLGTIKEGKVLFSSTTKYGPVQTRNSSSFDMDLKQK